MPQNIQSDRHISAAVPVLARKCDRLQYSSVAILGALLSAFDWTAAWVIIAGKKSYIHSQRDSGAAETQNEVGLERQHRDRSHDLGNEPQLGAHRVRISERVGGLGSAVQLFVLD